MPGRPKKQIQTAAELENAIEQLSELALARAPAGFARNTKTRLSSLTTTRTNGLRRGADCCNRSNKRYGRRKSYTTCIGSDRAPKRTKAKR